MKQPPSIICELCFRLTSDVYYSVVASIQMCQANIDVQLPLFILPFGDLFRGANQVSFDSFELENKEL